MSVEMMVAAFVILGATALMVILYAWSARRIETIHSKNLTSLRQIKREFSGGRERDA
jgi:hypothetical protein